MSRAGTLARAIGSDGTLNVADVGGLAAVASSGSATDLTTGTLPIGRLTPGALSLRNLLGNGDFRLSQRGNYTAGLSLPGGSAYYLDRFKIAVISGSYTLTHKLNQSVNGLTTNTLRIDCTSNATNGGIAIEQWVEDFALLQGVPLVFSCWYKSNFNSFYNFYDGQSQVHTSMPNTSGVWTQFSATYTPASNATQVRTEFYPNTTTPQSGNYIEFAFCQLERNTVATPFEIRPYALEVAMARRYCQLIVPATQEWIYIESGATTTNRWWQCSYPQMYGSPSVTLKNSWTGGGGGAIGTISNVQTVQSTTTRSTFRITGNSTTATNNTVTHTDYWNASGAYLILESELG